MDPVSTEIARILAELGIPLKIQIESLLAGGFDEEFRLSKFNSFGIPKRVAEDFIDPIKLRLREGRQKHPTFVQQLQAMGVQVVQASLAVTQFLEVALEYPTPFTLLTDHTDDVEVCDLVLTNAAYSRKALRQVRLAGNALVIGLQRNGEIIVPNGDTMMEVGDTLLLLGSPPSLLESAAMLDGSGK